MRTNFVATRRSVLESIGALAGVSALGTPVPAAAQSRNEVLVNTTGTPGNYRVRAGGDTDGVNLGFSANLSAEASRLNRVDPDRLKAVFGDLSFRLAKNKEEIDRNVSLDRVGRELFPFLIALVAILLAVEHLLANRFYREAAPAAAPAGAVAAKS